MMSEPVFKLSRVSNAPISDEELIADLRRVAEILVTENVTIKQYDQYGEYGHTTQQNRFGAWNDALLRSGLIILKEMNISEDKLITDMLRVAELLGTENVIKSQYEAHGEYGVKTLEDRFGTWNKALLRAGLTISKRVDIPDIDLFENILTLWLHYGRQPRVRELDSAPSFILSSGPYKRRFGSWMNALNAFIDYANRTDADIIESAIEEVIETPITDASESVIDETIEITENLIENKTEISKNIRIVIIRDKRRNASPLQKCQVLIRDKGVCQLCNRPLDNLDYHIDHIFPWIKGGPTILSNLQLLCSKCNIIKGALDLTDYWEQESSR
jgi:hypothetical protein